MSRWLLAALAIVAALAPASVAAGGGSGPPDTIVDNEFIPDDRNLSDCISALPEPGCGSENRSGWRQWVILGAIVAALAFITWRVVRAARRPRGIP